MKRIMKKSKWGPTLAILLLLCLVWVVAADIDLTIAGQVNTVPSSTVFAKETNPVAITNVKNNGPDAVTGIVVALYASDVSATVPVSTTTISSLASGAQTTRTLVDPTIRNTEGGSVIYTAKVDPDNLIAETDETNNDKASAANPLKFNGYKGKRYWDGNDITTKETYDLNGGVVYYTQPDTAYKVVGWTTRTETWTSSNLPLPAGAVKEKVLLFVSYNWDTTPGGVPNLVTTFNTNTITLGTPFTDKSNFGSYGDNYYGLFTVDVTSLYDPTGNNDLVISPGSGNSNALYPSTLVVIYRDPGSTRKQIFINEECDLLAYSESSYGTTMAEATAYAPFSGMTITTGNVESATLHSFVAGAGPNEGNLLFNGASVATNAWQGTSNTASAGVFDVTSHLTATGNEAGIQGTQSGGMSAVQQILVIEYAVASPVAAFTNATATPRSGTAPLTVQFTDQSTNTPKSWRWSYKNATVGWTQFSTLQNPLYTFPAGTYDINLTATNDGGSDDEIKTGYVSAVAASTPTIEITLGNNPVTLSNMIRGQDATGQNTVTVTPSGGTSWTVSAKDGKTTNKGFMVNGTTPLINPFQLGKNGGAFQALTSDYTSFMSGTAMSTTSATASLKQPVVTADGIGTYAITITFTGSIT